MKNKKNNVTLVKPSTKPVQPDEKVALKNVKPDKTLHFLISVISNLHLII